MTHKSLQNFNAIDYCSGNKDGIQSETIIMMKITANQSNKRKRLMKKMGWYAQRHSLARRVNNNRGQSVILIPIEIIPLLPTSESLAVSSTTDYPTSAG